MIAIWLSRQGDWVSWYETVNVYPSPLGHVWIFYRDHQYGFAHWLHQETIGV
ncbi:hypothetical protein [Rhizobium phage RHph_X2_28B]|uniref:hypothetical protein n=1 Tax=Rhizobium phage RHph_X2_28B TaxID=2836086 RepID=UPI0023291B03|nr:hypothetical protein PP751_gp095 [Rhizobium phage RHph_X2_28B]QWY83552.1 hypothetical protein [Rhizobium phage RHph_X2_28B]